MSIKIDYKGLNGAISNSQTASQSKTKSLLNYEELKRTYDEKKKEHDEWCAKYRNAAGSAQYEEYTKQFRDWEMKMLTEIQEALKRENSQNDEISGDLYVQLNSLLTKCSRFEFILAFLHAKNMDPSLFATVCQSLNLDGASSSNQAITHNSLRANLAANPPKLFPLPASSSISSPAQYATPPSRLPVPVQSYQMPESRFSDPVLYRPEKLPPPPRTYAENPKLPFFDIGGSR